MRTLILALCIIATACVTRVQPPAAPTVPQQPEQPKQPKLIDRFVAQVPALGKCDAWTDNSVLCHPSPTQILYCSAKEYEAPRCQVALDWTPPAPQPATATAAATATSIEPSAPTAPAKPVPKKK